MDEIKFLLIEDSQEDADLVEQQLKKEFRFTVQTAKDKQEYADCLNNFNPNIILCCIDDKTPEDYWALNYRNEKFKETPFILITPTYKDEIAINSFRQGATNYISKKHLVRLNFAVKVALQQVKLTQQKQATEKELEESLEHFKKFVIHDISGDYLENENEVTFCNDKVLEIFGFKNIEELNAFGTGNLYQNPEDRENLINELKRGKRVLNREFHMLTKTGKPIIVLENAYANLDEEGNIITLQGYLIDITKQRHYEEQLKESENLFRTLTESTSAAIVIYDDQHFLYTNQAFEKMMGSSREELSKIHFWEIAHPDHMKIIKERGQARVHKKKVVSDYQFKVVNKKGQIIWVDYQAAPIIYKNRSAAIGTLYNITEQKNAAQEIKKLSTVIEQSPLSIIITDIDGKIEYVNRAFLAKSGYTFKEIIGENPRILKSGQTPKETYDDLWKTVSSGMVWKGNLINKMKDGSIYTEIAVIFPIFGDDGKVIRFAAIKRDVSLEKEIEKELLVEKRRAEEANRLKTGILTNMSHELRTPLNGILGFSTLISDSGDLAEIREMTQYIQESGQRLLRTLNMVIEISAMESGNFEPDYHEIDLNDIIRKIVREFKEEAEKKSIEIKFDDPMASFTMVSDLKFTHGAIENLVDNAVKFTNEGWVSISAEELEEDDLNYVVINIGDTGIGISEKNQKVIFEDFQQESMGYNRVYEGTGLGLSLAKKYVELLGGFIKLKSKVGEGSTFSIYVPVNHQSPN